MSHPGDVHVANQTSGAAVMPHPQGEGRRDEEDSGLKLAVLDSIKAAL